SAPWQRVYYASSGGRRRFPAVGPLHRNPAMSRIATQWRSLRTHVLEYRAQLSHAVRVATVAVLSLMLSQLLHLPLPLWPVLTGIILTQVSFGRSLKVTVDYLAGTLGGAVYAGALAALVPHTSEVALVALLVVAVAPLALLGAINPSFNAATLTGALVLLVPGVTHTGPIESAFYRVIEVAVGSIAALAVSLLVLPARAQSLAIEAAAQMLDLAARSVPELFAGFAEARDAAAMARIHDSIGQSLLRSNAMAAEAKHERIGVLTAAADLGPLLRTLLRLRHDLVMIGRAAAVPLPAPIRLQLG